MRSIVTGATGFIGSHLVRVLLAQGDDVAVLVRPQSDRWRLADVVDRVAVLDATSTSVAVSAEAFAPDALFHLAWAGVHGGRRDDPNDLAANLRLTADVMELAALAGCTVIVGLGSQAEFGPSAGVIDERTPSRPQTLYGIGKLAAGLLVGQTAGARGLRGAWLRLLSAYGPGDEPSYLVPYMIRELLAGRSPRLSSGEQPHDTLFVVDVAEALRAAAVSERCRGTYVLASGAPTSVREVAELVAEIVGPAPAIQFGEAAGHPGWSGSHRRLTDDTGWSPSTTLRVGLAETVLWYRRHGHAS